MGYPTQGFVQNKLLKKIRKLQSKRLQHSCKVQDEINN